MRHSNLLIVLLLSVMLFLFGKQYMCAQVAKEPFDWINKKMKNNFIGVKFEDIYNNEYSDYSITYTTKDNAEFCRAEDLVDEMLKSIDTYHSFDEKFDSAGVWRRRVAVKPKRVSDNIVEIVNYESEGTRFSLDYEVIESSGSNVATDDFLYMKYLMLNNTVKETEVQSLEDLFYRFMGIKTAKRKNLFFSGNTGTFDTFVSKKGKDKSYADTDAVGCYISNNGIKDYSHYSMFIKNQDFKEAISLFNEFVSRLYGMKNKGFYRIAINRVDVNSGYLITNHCVSCNIFFQNEKSLYVKYQALINADGIFFLRSVGRNPGAISIRQDWMEKLKE